MHNLLRMLTSLSRLTDGASNTTASTRKRIGSHRRRTSVTSDACVSRPSTFHVWLVKTTLTIYYTTWWRAGPNSCPQIANLSFPNGFKLGDTWPLPLRLPASQRGGSNEEVREVEEEEVVKEKKKYPGVS